MTIHYATGTAADIHDMLAELSGFATGTLGWVQDEYSTSVGGDPDVTRLHLHDGGRHWSMQTYIASSIHSFGAVASPTVELYCCAGYDAAQNFDAQPGTHTQRTAATQIDGTAMTWHAYGGSGAHGDYLHWVCEVRDARVASIHLGALHPNWVGGTNGGHYAAAAAARRLTRVGMPFRSERHGYGDDHLRADIDGAASPHYMDWDDGELRAYDADRTRDLGVSSVNAQTPLWPLYVVAERPDNHRSLLGVVPGIRECRLNLLSPGDELTLGSSPQEVWQVWPVLRRGDILRLDDTPGSEHTGWYGFAYRKS